MTICSAAGDKGKNPAGQGTDQGGGDGSTGGSVGVGGTGGNAGDPNNPNEEEQLDGKAAKDCVECWNDETRTQGGCAEEAARCRDSLACTQLQWCPLICEQENCVDGCNEIIPSGVAPLTAIVRCVACGDAPCTEACQDSHLLSYCE